MEKRSREALILPVVLALEVVLGEQERRVVVF